MITINGSYGEGGGQILRSALALSLVTGKPFRIEKIRAGRKKPGLMRQHLTAVNAAAEVGAARVSGNAIGSQAFAFAPQTIRCGRFHWSIGTAGSCTLVLQTILPALIIAGGPSQIVLEGGTHNPFAPPFDFLARVFLPLLARMGPRIVAELERPGFFPAGGGRMRITIDPAASLNRLELKNRGPVRRQSARAIIANLNPGIARRELKVVAKALGLASADLQTICIDNAPGPGNVLFIDIESETLTEVFTGFGQRGVSAETVAARAAGQARDYLAAAVPVGRYLADQLLVPMAIAGGGAFVTLPPSRHTLTNIDIIRHFMALSCEPRETGDGAWEIDLCTEGVNR
ncbi:RtcA: RNA 3'-terminal phosphate cyclase (RNA cyclase) [Desulfosarcina variabilis str. Montpellier]|uniref:RNA 3'-terminal phosphate cyclase n=1 Tax=Desulfosarcina variabilis TaxID=2300 RepID=UPI003AFAC057